MEKLLEKLEEECECHICYEIFQQPKTFTCLHTFCLPCLNKLAEKHRADGAVPCPKCRKQIPIPHDGTFDSAASSFLHNRLVELLKIRTSSYKNISCGNCKKKTADCSFCFDCSKIYCRSCLDAHAVLKAEHKVRALTDFHTEDYQDFLQRPMLCSEKLHESQPLVFYCKHCQTCLCQLCVVVNKDLHDQHKIISLEEAATAKRDSLVATVGWLNQNKEILDKCVQEMDKITREIDERVDSAKSEVKRFTDFLIANILRHREASLAQLEIVRTSRKDIANQKKNNFKEKVEQVKDAIKFGTTLISSKVTKELLKEEEIYQHFEDLLNVERDFMEETRVNTFVKFIPGNETRFVGSENQQIGQILTERFSDPFKSRLLNEAVAENRAAIKVSGLSVVTKSSDGERQYLPTDKVKLIVEPAVDVSDVQVTDNMNASYDVSFVPRVPGSYQVQVKLNDHNIAGSPVEMHITERKLTRVCTYNIPEGRKSELFGVGVAVSKEGDVAVSDRKNHYIVMFDKTGNFLRKLSHSGSKKGELSCPNGIAFNSRDELVVADGNNHRIQVLDKRSGGVIRAFGRHGSGEGEFKFPTGVYVDETDRVVVTDYHNNRVQVFDEDGKFLFQFGEKCHKLCWPCHCVSYQNFFVVADSSNHEIKVYDSEGRFLYGFGERGKQDGQFEYPDGLVVDGRGNLFVCDLNNNRVQMFTVDGRFIGKTTCELLSPFFAALLDDDNLVVSEYRGGRLSILKLS